MGENEWPPRWRRLLVWERNKTPQKRHDFEKVVRGPRRVSALRKRGISERVPGLVLFWVHQSTQRSTSLYATWTGPVISMYLEWGPMWEHALYPFGNTPSSVCKFELVSAALPQ